MGDIIAGELERGFAADTRLSVLRKRGETVEFFKDGEVELSGFDGLKTAEVLVMLVKAADDQFGGVVGGGDESRADGIDQPGPMEFEESEDGDGGRGSFQVGWLEG